MSKVLKTVATIAGAVALVAGTVALTVGTGGAFLGVSAALWGTIATAASIASAVAATGAQLLTKPPPSRGSETKIQIGVEPPSPYLMGEAYSAGVLRHDAGYGATLNKVPNPYRALVVVASVAGPLAACTPMVDFSSDLSWYSTYLYTDTQLGAQPEAAALTPHFAGLPGWDADSKLSGQGAILWNAKFDKDGKRFASGLPNLGAVWQGVAVYDPRLDDTFPGGAGTHRIDDESTWEYSDNPALHAIAYAYGRYANGKKVFGIGQPAAGIDLARFAAWANVCEANGWSISGTIYEPGDRWANLKDIMVSGCGEPVVTGGVLSVRYRAPQVSLATVTEDDIADDDLSITAMQSYRARVNGISPKYRNPDANWEFTAAETVTVPTYVTEDGEERVEERQWNLVKDVDQVAQLAAYALVDARELGPIEVTLKPQWRWVKPGDCLTLDFPSLDFDGDAVVIQREIDPATMKVKLTLIGETEAKHDYALGLTGTPPPTPALGQTAQERDELAAAAVSPAGYDTALITSSYVTDADPLDGLLQATDTAITVEDHVRTYADKSVAVTGGTLTVEADGVTALSDDTLYHVYYDDPDRAGGAVALKATQVSTDAATSDSNPDRHYVGSLATDVTGGTGTSGGGATPPGWRDNIYEN
ncbi:hypothetical protein ACWPMX_07745 [Tsuneonella sp. HG094]